MENKFIIRAAHLEDAHKLMVLIEEFAAYADLRDSLQITEQNLIDHVLAGDKANALIAELDGYPVGYALYYETFSSFMGKVAMYLEDIYITPLFRKKGYGREIFNVLTEIAIAKNYYRLEWKCLKWNQKAQGFYESIGAAKEDKNMTYMLYTDESQTLKLH